MKDKKYELSSREIQMISLAVQECVALKDYKGCYKVLADEMNEISEKLNYELTPAGNQIKRGFSWAGCNGTEYNILNHLSTKGYKTIYNDAPYDWSMVNFETFHMFTYCEGDTNLIICKDRAGLVKEIKRTMDFFKDDKEKVDDIKYCLKQNKFKIAG